MTRGLLGCIYAAIGAIAIVLGALFTLGWLAQIHPILAAITAAVGLAILLMLTLDRVLNAPSRSAVVRAYARDYRAVVDEGRATVRELSDIAWIAAIVLGWAAIGVLGAVVCFLPGILLGAESPAMAIAMLAIPVFFGCLVIGPLWTWRRLHP